MTLAPRMMERPIIKATTGCMGRGRVVSADSSGREVEEGNRTDEEDVVAIVNVVRVGL